MVEYNIPPRNFGTIYVENIDLTDSTNTNTKYGYEALNSITTAESGVFFGYESGKSLTTGNANTFVGRETGKDITTGVNNVAIGYRALRDVSSSISYICAVGFGALQKTTGGTNSAFGYLCLNKCEGGNSNTAMGYTSAYNVTSGSKNCFYGKNSGYSITTGDNNIMIGEDAGNNASQKVDGDNMILIGEGIYSDESNIVKIGNSNTNKTEFAGASQAAFVADATDLTSVITLSNALKTLLVNYKFMASS